MVDSASNLDSQIWTAKVDGTLKVTRFLYDKTQHYLAKERGPGTSIIADSKSPDENTIFVFDIFRKGWGLNIVVKDKKKPVGLTGDSDGQDLHVVEVADTIFEIEPIK